ncbi:HNH endonuclease [Microbacterium oleivorans]|uniref:HNH endonuclease n=1 Tax=Microbacterium oleivorans TaxID=273677 RepID=UPI001404CA16|nr:HNH endonuclease [Microbacterium oleivorans]
MANNPAWTYEELVLAVDLIDRRDWVGGNAQTPELIDLSRLLRIANFPGHDDVDETFRSVNSISMKLGNLKGANPHVEGGLRATKRETEVVEHFLENREVMRALAESLRQGKGVNPDEPEVADVLDDEEAAVAVEGGPKYVLALRRERSVRLRRRKLHQVRRDGAQIVCEVCAFDFHEVYGEHGSGYIEVHHRTPLHVSGETESDLDDLALLCANCHRMIHRRGWMEVHELGALVGEPRPDITLEALAVDITS